MFLEIPLLVHDFVLVMLLLVLMIGPLRVHRRFVLIIILALFVELLSHDMLLKGLNDLFL
jgi:hypothetical protein